MNQPRDARGRFIRVSNDDEKTSKKKESVKTEKKIRRSGFDIQDGNGGRNGSFSLGKRKLTQPRDARGRFIKVIPQPKVTVKETLQTTLGGPPKSTVPEFIAKAREIPISKKTRIQTVDTKGRFTKSDFVRYRIATKQKVETGEVYKVNNRKYGIVKGQPKYKEKTVYGKWKKITRDQRTMTDSQRLRSIIVSSAQYHPRDIVEPTHIVDRELLKTPVDRKFVYIVSGQGKYEGEKERENKTIRITVNDLLTYDELWADFNEIMGGSDITEGFKSGRRKTKPFKVMKSTFKVEMAFAVE